MTTPTTLPSGLLQIIRDVLRQELPDFELVSVELPRVQPAPPEIAERGLLPLLAPSPPLGDLQAHFRALGFGRPLRQLPAPRAPEPEAGEVQEPGLIHCRIRPRDSVDQEAAEIAVLISVTGKTVVGM